MSFLTGLNSSQREAVQTLHGPLLILAGAGTGKTRVITCRIANLILHGIRPSKILSVTFTNKAAREMKDRAMRLLNGPRNAESPEISTFHSLCVKILRREAHHLGFPNNFVIYDRSDQESAARAALKNIQVTEKTMKPSDLINRISRWKTDGILPETAREIADEDLDFLAASAYRRYQQQLKSSGAVDFDDLLLLTEELFQNHPEVLEREQSRYNHVQIDEYQDTNLLQFRLMEALVRPHQNLCVVGDDDQSIYGWRGADIQHILGFASVFPNTKTVRLEQNYRCTDRILDVANRLVQHNLARHRKTLISNKSSSDPVRNREYPDEDTEAAQVASEIQFLIREGTDPGQIAVLFRTNEQPRLFEAEFRRRRIPYTLVGTSSFFDRTEVRDLFAYLRVILQDKDDVSLRRIINKPARGIGETSVSKISDYAIQHKLHFWDAPQLLVRNKEISANTFRAIETFHDLLRRYHRNFIEQPRQMGNWFRALVAEIGYEAEIEKLHKTAEKQMQKCEIIEQIADTIDQYLARTKSPSLSEFLEESALDSRFENEDEEKSKQPGVKLMTIHSAKGLEFPRVFIVGLEEGILPHQRSIDLDTREAIEEERRLLYVAITRARDHLTLTRASSRRKWGRVRPTAPSRFLFELAPSKAPVPVPSRQGMPFTPEQD